MYLTQNIKLKSSNISTQHIRVSDRFIHQAKDGMKSKTLSFIFYLFRDCYLVMFYKDDNIRNYFKFEKSSFIDSQEFQ